MAWRWFHVPGLLLLLLLSWSYILGRQDSTDPPFLETARPTAEKTGNRNLSRVVQRGLDDTLARLHRELAENGLAAEEVVPRQVLIVTTWRSGSSFLGDLLNSHPGTFYYFEPLIYYTRLSQAEARRAPDPVDLVRSLLACSARPGAPGLLARLAGFLRSNNRRLWAACARLLPANKLCLTADYFARACRLFPVQLVKTTRMRVAQVAKLVADPGLALKVVLLVRDPRGVYQSRSEGSVAGWCKRPECASPAVGCRDLLADTRAAEALAAAHPGSITLLRYEDLGLRPEETARRLLAFLGLPWSPAIESYITSHTGQQAGRQPRKITYTTVRNSSATVFAWRGQMALHRALEIQAACREPMVRLGYRLLGTEGELRGEETLLERTAQEVWGG